MKLFLHLIILILLSFVVTACFHDDDNGGGWITITSPTTANSYNVENDSSITVAGQVFVSSDAGEREETYCDCIGWECLLYPPEYFNCYTYSYYDTAITVTITNDATGQVVNGSVSGSGGSNYWSGSVSLVMGENLIRVHAVDRDGLSGSDQITIYLRDTLAPSVSSVFPGDNTVVDIPDSIVVYFSEHLNLSSSNITSFTLHDGETNVPGAVAFEYNYIMTFTPSPGFSYNTLYDVTLNASVQDFSGNTGLINTGWSFTTTRAPAPTNLQASTDDGQIILNWVAKTDADSYNIYYDTAHVDISTATQITGITSTSHSPAGLTSGLKYYFKVTAVNDDGESFASGNASAYAGVRVKQFGTSAHDLGNDIAVDTSGNSYVAGETSGDLAGTGNAGNKDVFISKYDNSGNPLWLRQIGTVYSDAANSIAVDINGNSYITGETWGDLAGTGSTLDLDVFIAKYDTSGNQLWIRQFGTAPNETDEAYGIAVDTSGNSYVTGRTDGDLSGAGNAGRSDVFIVKYDTSGNQLWAKQFGSDQSDWAYDIAVDANANSYITGYTQGDLAGTGNIGGFDGFIAKYDTSGNQLWVKQFGTPLREMIHGIAVDADGNSYVTGYTDGEFSGTVSAGGDDVFITKYDSSGNHLWVRLLGSVNNDNGYGVTVDANGNSYVTGYTLGDITGSGNLGYSDVFIAKYDASGNSNWIRQLGTTSSESGVSIAVDTGGKSYVTGRTSGDFSGAGNAGGNDVFILNLYP